MKQKIKKTLSRLVKKKKTVFLLLVFVILGGLLASQLAYAQIRDINIPEMPETGTSLLGGVKETWSSIKNLPITLPLALVGTFAWVAATFYSFLAGLAVLLLKWILSPDFINISYTNPANNEIIRTGLGITQSFVNMVLVLVLVYIALATILRLAGYETKKLLVTFIIVALLVNFAPVFCGLIVDAANITMNFFIGGDKLDFGANLLPRAKTLLDAFTKDIWGNVFTGSEKERNLLIIGVTQIAVLGAVYLISALLYLLFAIVFLIRYIMIWFLVILSPLAFACLILPATKKYWTMWWNQFIQWSIIGITCGFFLYLAEQFASIAPAKLGQVAGETTIASNILPLFVPVVFLFLAIIVGLQTSAMGASTIMSLSKRSGKWVGKRAWKEGIRPNIDRALSKISGGRLTTRTAAGAISRGVERVPIARWFLPESIRKYGEYGQAIDAAQTRTKDLSSRTLVHRSLVGADIEEQATGNLLEVLTRTDGQDLFEGGKKLFGAKTDEELLHNPKFIKIVGRMLQIGEKGGKINHFVRRDPRLAAVAAAAGVKGYSDLTDQVGNPLKGEALERAAVTKAVSDARAQHITNWEPEVFENRHVTEATLGHFDRERWLQVNRTIKRGQESTHRGLDSALSDFIEKDPEFEGLSVEQIQGKLKDLTPEEIKAKVKLKIEAELEEEDVKPKDWGKELKIRLEKRLPEALQDPRSDASKATWKKFRENIKKQNQGLEGYFKALEDKRVQQTGWRAGKYIPKSERWGREGAPPTPPGGAAVGPKPTPPSGRRPGGAAPSGRRPGSAGPSGRRAGGGGTPSGRRT